MDDTRDLVMQADYWQLWELFTLVVADLYSYEALNEIRTVARSHGLRKIRRNDRDGDRFGAVWRQAISLGDEAELDVVATHLTDPDRPDHAEH